MIERLGLFVALPFEVLDSLQYPCNASLPFCKVAEVSLISHGLAQDDVAKKTPRNVFLFHAFLVPKWDSDKLNFVITPTERVMGGIYQNLHIAKFCSSKTHST